MRKKLQVVCMWHSCAKAFVEMSLYMSMVLVSIPFVLYIGIPHIHGGDRGEDVGSVHACWRILEQPPPGAVAERAQKDDSSAGTQCVRLATITEVAQLQGIQNELEARATEVAQQKARDHNLNICC